MRASRLLQILLLLQNRGRLTCATLAEELEVTRRTILRDIDALTEAGLPVVVVRGNQGGIELGFNYRTRLTGLDADEAEAIGILLTAQSKLLGDLGMADAAQRAVRKLIESFPDTTRKRILLAQSQFQIGEIPTPATELLQALVKAVRQRNIIRINANTKQVKVVHPASLLWAGEAWHISDAAQNGTLIALAACGNINISAKCF